MTGVATSDRFSSFSQQETFISCTDLDKLFDERDVDVDFFLTGPQSSCSSAVAATSCRRRSRRSVDEHSGMIEPLDLSLSDLLGFGDDVALSMADSPQDVNACMSFYAQLGAQTGELQEEYLIKRDSPTLPDLTNLIDGVFDGSSWDELEISFGEANSNIARRVSKDLCVTDCAAYPLDYTYSAPFSAHTDAQCTKTSKQSSKSDFIDSMESATSTVFKCNDTQSDTSAAMLYDTSSNSHTPAYTQSYLVPMYYNPAAVAPLPYAPQGYTYSVPVPVTAPVESFSSIRRPKQCVVENCVRRAQSNNRCKSHGGGARCQVQGCEKSSQGGGLCRAHGGGKKCGVPGCTKGTQRLGLCYLHGGIRRCLTDGCKKKDRGNGFCISHGGGRRCHVIGCRRSVRKGNHCQAHQAYET